MLIGEFLSINPIFVIDYFYYLGMYFVEFKE